MANKINAVQFTNALIDADDMTLTEITDDSFQVYDLQEILKCWNGKGNIELTIRQVSPLPSDRGC